MKTVIECGHCQIKFKIDLNTIPDTGRSNGCPNCGRPVHIPSPDEMVLEPCDDDVGGGKRSTVEPVLPMLDLPVLIDPPPVPGARSQKERQRLLRWSVALAVGLLLALAVSGGRQYLGLRQSLMQAQGNLMATSQSMQSERERFKQLEQRHIQLRQEQAQRHLSEVRQVAARGLRLLEEERKNRAWDVRELKEENLKLRAQIRRLEKKSAQHAASKGGPPRRVVASTAIAKMGAVPGWLKMAINISAAGRMANATAKGSSTWPMAIFSSGVGYSVNIWGVVTGA